MQPGNSRRKQNLRSTIPPGYTQGNTPCGIREMPAKNKPNLPGRRSLSGYTVLLESRNAAVTRLRREMPLSLHLIEFSDILVTGDLIKNRRYDAGTFIAYLCRRSI